MAMSNVCTTDQKVLVGWLKRKGNAKIPSDCRELTNNLVTDARTRVEPTLAQYLANKGKSKTEISTYLGLTMAQLSDYTDDEGGCIEAAIGLLSFLGGEGEALEGSKANGMDTVLEEEQV